MAGNLPHGGLILWSVIGTIAVILSIGIMFYYYGKLDPETELNEQQGRMPPFATTDMIDRYTPTPTQRATYRFFAVAAILFQVAAGLLMLADFWRWCTIHMWVEAFFELFTTIIVSYFLYLMGFVSHRMARPGRLSRCAALPRLRPDRYRPQLLLEREID